MRAVRLALAACLLLLAVGVTAIDSQASARSVEDRWKNCSQINRGRLGALHDVDGSTVQANFNSLQYPANATNDYVTINFSPCVPSFGLLRDDYIVITSVSTWGTAKNLPGRFNTAEFNQVLVAGTNTVATANGQQRLVTFTMPDTSDAVPMLTANYRSTSITGPTISLAVTAKCDPSTQANVTVFNATGTQWTMTINTKEACARFPYTNQALPAGGVAALIICIVCFLLEFAACFKYHQDNKNHSPLDEESMR